MRLWSENDFAQCEDNGMIWWT